MGTSPIISRFHWPRWNKYAVGDSGALQIEKGWLDEAEEVYEHMPETFWEIYRVFCGKQHDYGPDNISMAGATGVAIRMADKFSRLFNLLGLTGDKVKKEAVVDDEDIYKTVEDLADYAIILMVVLKDKWPKKSFQEWMDEATSKERHIDSTVKQLPLFEPEVE